MIYKYVGYIFGGLLVLLLLFLIVWMIVAGPVTVGRIIRYGDTKIDDFSHYPGRTLQPADSPYRFAESETELPITADGMADFGSGGDLAAFLQANDTIAFLVVRNEAIIYERYYQGHSESLISQSFSVSKSVTSALIGMAIDDGLIQSVNQPVTDYVPELTDEGFDMVTLEHLLTMTSGSSYQENDNPFGEHVILNYTPQLEARILDFTMERSPGEVWRYKSGDNALLSLALDRALGDETITDYAQRRMWDTLGMQDRGQWSIDSQDGGLERSWCCLAASARDFAKLGLLFLNRGVWNGQQILFEDWVARSTHAQVSPAIWPDEFVEAGWHNYGYQWWLASQENSDYFALGKDGQFIYVHPGTSTVIVRIGWSSGELLSSQWVDLFQVIAEIIL